MFSGFVLGNVPNPLRNMRPSVRDGIDSACAEPNPAVLSGNTRKTGQNQSSRRPLGPTEIQRTFEPDISSAFSPPDATLVPTLLG